MAKLKVAETVGNLGEYLREQRNQARLSLRQLAELTGVSNPYLSQIERGLRKPSAEVLQQLAKALRVSAETLYVHAGMLEPDTDGERPVQLAVLADAGLTERQKQVLLDIYESFRRENGRDSGRDNGRSTDEGSAAEQDTQSGPRADAKVRPDLRPTADPTAQAPNSSIG